jgi:DNA-binding Lrp family transcriptional regulator
MADLSQEEIKEKILEFLTNAPGKGVEAISKIAKGVGVDRRQASSAVRELEEEGKIEPGGVMAGVAGYKIKKD